MRGPSRVLRRFGARVAPALPRSLVTRIQRARALAAGLDASPPRARRVLVLAAHPDDETLACGGTLALLADAGATLTVVVATDGEATRGSPLPAAETAERRRAETRAAAQILGTTDVRFLGHPDGALSDAVAGLSVELRSVIDELRPDLVLLPWFLDANDDHRALNHALAAASPDAATEVWGGEIWTPLVPNRIVDISSVVDRKRDAIGAHVTASRAFDIGAMLALNRYRSVHVWRGEGYAEAFVAADGAAYAAAVRELAS